MIEQIKISPQYKMLLVLLIFIAGCSMWDNFTTYYNRYYKNRYEIRSTNLKHFEIILNTHSNILNIFYHGCFDGVNLNVSVIDLANGLPDM